VIFQYERLIRPFPIRRLTDVTHPVRNHAGVIGGMIFDLQLDPPRLPEVWWGELQRIIGELLTLRDEIDELIPKLMEMQDDADRQFEVALDALVAMMRGLREGDDDDLPDVSG